eukprot:g27092.t1
MGCSNSREIEKIHEQLDAEDAARSPVRTLQRGAKPQPETTPLPGEAVAGKEDPKDKGEEAEIFEAEVKKDGPKKEEDWVEQDQVPKKKRMEEIETAQIKDQLAEVGDTVAIEEDSKQGSETAKVEEDPKPEKENETEQIEEEVLAVDWFESARLGHVPTMKQHLKKAEDDQVEHFLDSEAEERQTALHFTAQRGHFAACEWLLSMKADAGAITKKKATALHMAASFGHLKVVELLVDDPQLCSVAAADLWRCTPLHRAAEGGFSDVALVLLKKAADPQKADRDGNSPLHFASTPDASRKVRVELNLAERTSPPDFSPEACGAFFFTPKKTGPLGTSFRADAPVFVPRDMSAEFETPTKEAPDSFVAVRSRMLRMRQLLEDESKCQGPCEWALTRAMAKQVQLNDFEMVRTLGCGSFGRVRFAKYKPERPVKFMKKHEIIKLKQVDHINNEKRLMAQISYPFIVNMMGYAKDLLWGEWTEWANETHFVYIIMECISGGELFTHLRRARKFSDEQSKFYGLQAWSETAAAFAHIHGKNIIHRDLKPENILLCPNGYSKLTDFGFAKIVEPGTRTYTLCGTPEYIAPEVLLNKGHGKPVDWWTLGILIYEMICGQPPFCDEDPMGIYQKILAGKVYFPKYFDKNAKSLVKKLLVADLSKRFGNLKDGAADILQNKWFSTYELPKLEALEYPAPYKPAMKDENDISNFEEPSFRIFLLLSVVGPRTPLVRRTPSSIGRPISWMIWMRLPESAQEVQAVRNTARCCMVALKSRSTGGPMAKQVQLQDFEMVRTLGCGSFGRVRFAKYKPERPGRGGRRRAAGRGEPRRHEIIKLKQVDHINNEKRLMAQISYPFIVNMMGYAKEGRGFGSNMQDDHFVYIIMECISGGELFTHLRRARKFSDEQSKFYGLQTAAAFAHIHGKNIIHRDLKPENILLCPNGYSKLTDFGFAKIVEPGTRTYTLCGTPEYIAPEVLLNKGHGKPVDWWTLGILVYEMICGQPPFCDEDPMGIYQKILAGKVYFPKYFDKNAKSLVKKLLVADLSKRFGNLKDETAAPLIHCQHHQRPKDGAADILQSKWFSTYELPKMEAMEYPAPYKPSMKDDNDVSNFEDIPDSTDMPPKVTAAQESGNRGQGQGSLEDLVTPFKGLFV